MRISEKNQKGKKNEIENCVAKQKNGPKQTVQKFSCDLHKGFSNDFHPDIARRFHTHHTNSVNPLCRVRADRHTSADRPTFLGSILFYSTKARIWYYHANLHSKGYNSIYICIENFYFLTIKLMVKVKQSRLKTDNLTKHFLSNCKISSQLVKEIMVNNQLIHLYN